MTDTAYLIETKPGLPVHPVVSHLNSLPEMPGMCRYRWNSCTKAQTEKLLIEWRMAGPLPGKGNALFINLPSGELVRVTKAKGSPAMYAVEMFRK